MAQEEAMTAEAKRKLRRRSREVRSGLLITALMDRMQLVEAESDKVKREAAAQLSLVSQQLLYLEGRLRREQTRVSQLVQDKENIILSQKQEIHKLRQALAAVETAAKTSSGSMRRVKRERSSAAPGSSTDDNSSPGSSPKHAQLGRKLSDDPKLSAGAKLSDEGMVAAGVRQQRPQLLRQLSADPVLPSGVNLTRQTKLISRGAERPRLKQSISVGNLTNQLEDSTSKLKGILKVSTFEGRKPPVPSRQAVNQKLTGRQEQLRAGSVSDDSGRESDVKTTQSRHRDSGNSSLDSSDSSLESPRPNYLADCYEEYQLCPNNQEAPLEALTGRLANKRVSFQPPEAASTDADSSGESETAATSAAVENRQADKDSPEKDVATREGKKKLIEPHDTQAAGKNQSMPFCVDNTQSSIKEQLMQQLVKEEQDGSEEQLKPRRGNNHQDSGKSPIDGASTSRNVEAVSWSSEHQVVDRLDRLVAGCGGDPHTETPLLAALLATRPMHNQALLSNNPTTSGPSLMASLDLPSTTKSQARTTPAQHLPSATSTIRKPKLLLQQHVGVAELERLLARGATPDGKSWHHKQQNSRDGSSSDGSSLPRAKQHLQSSNRFPAASPPTEAANHCRSSSLSGGSSTGSMSICPASSSTLTTSSAFTTSSMADRSANVSATTTNSFSMTSGLLLAGSRPPPPSPPSASNNNSTTALPSISASSPSPSRLRSRFRAVLSEISQKVPQMGQVPPPVMTNAVPSSPSIVAGNTAPGPPKISKPFPIPQVPWNLSSARCAAEAGPPVVVAALVRKPLITPVGSSSNNSTSFCQINNNNNNNNINNYINNNNSSGKKCGMSSFSLEGNSNLPGEAMSRGSCMQQANSITIKSASTTFVVDTSFDSQKFI